MTASSPDWRQLISKDEIRELRTQRDWRSWMSIAQDYSIIAGAMALVAVFPNLGTVLLALVLIGGRQLGFAVLSHEASHRTLFENRKLNDWAGNWLAAYPIFLCTDMYRPHHLDHHGKTWSASDPDLPLAVGFPVSKASMTRKVLRDLSGITGLKQLIGTSLFVYAAVTGVDQQSGPEPTRVSVLPMRPDRARAIKLLLGTLLTNGLLLAVLWALGHPALYLLWLGAWLTTHKLIVRIRSMAEHANVPEPRSDRPFGNTRTTLTRCWERLIFAPHYVGYHLEHHLVITVPHYNLPRFHRLLRERGALQGACIAHGYAQVLRQMIA